MRHLSARARWSVAIAAATCWAATRATTGREVFNAGGWSGFGEFWKSAASPDLAVDFVRLTIDATMTTAAFAVLGTVLSVTVGMIFGPIVSHRIWESSDQRLGWLWFRRGLRGLVRAAFVVPRAVHEVIWALLLIQVLGFDPLVAIVAIGIQFGAVTTKVYGDLIDDADPLAFRALRTGGARRTTALIYRVWCGSSTSS